MLGGGGLCEEGIELTGDIGGVRIHLARRMKTRHFRIATCLVLCAVLSALATNPAQAVLRAKSWGSNDYGQLGDDSLNPRSLPGNVLNLPGVKQMSAGCYHGLAVMKNGTVKAWGYGGDGALGNNSDDDVHVPSTIPGLANVKAVSAGCDHSLALKENGTVWAWGDNFYGALGDGDRPNNSLVPVKVLGLDDVKSVVAADALSVALRENGTVYAWGYNGYGQLGAGETGTHTDVPGRVSRLTNVRQVSAYSASQHVLALLENGSVRAWGNNTYGQLGDGSLDDANRPVRVVTINNVKSISGGYHHSLALTEEGVVWGWGQNDNGEMGDGTDVDKPAPVKVERLTGVKAIAAGEQHNLALKHDGTLRGWGRNTDGQLGDGTEDTSVYPVRVNNLDDVRQFDAGYDFSYAIEG